MAEIHELSAFDQLHLLNSGALTPTEATKHYLARIDRLNSGIGAFVTVTAEAAIVRAEGSFEGTHLKGMPHGDKDLAVRLGVPTLYGSLAVKTLIEQELSNIEPNDPIVELSDQIGLISLGKTNTPEFGLFGYTETTITGPARHPEDTTLGAGGSSGGAAVAVAARLLPFAIGSDGGGSIRIPAATVGLVGMKPTLGVIPTDVPGMTTTGVVNGPLARNVLDAALLFEALSCGYTGSVTGQIANLPEKLRIAFAVDSPWTPTYELAPDPLVLDALDTGLSAVVKIGHNVVQQVSLADDKYGRMFLTAWQRSAAGIPSMLDPNLLNPVTHWLMEQGRCLSAEAIAANDTSISRYRLRAPLIWETCDFLVTPALGLPPQVVGSYSDIPQENFAQQVQYSPYTSFVNLLGMPAIVIPTIRRTWGPAGRALPFGIQIVGKPGSDVLLLRLAGALEQHLEI